MKDERWQITGKGMKADKPQDLLTVVIPNYNYGAFVSESIASVCDQDYQPIELIIVDDGSTDNSVEMIHEAVKKAGHLHRVEVVALQKNVGKLAALNAVLDKMHGDYCITLDADDRLVPDYISRCMREFKRVSAHDPHLGFVYTDCNLMNADGSSLDRGRSTAFDADLVEEFSYIPEPALVKMDAYLEVAPFDTSIRVATKHHKWLRMVSNGWTGHHIAEPLFFYRMHTQNISGIGRRVTTEVENGRRGERILSGYWDTARA